MTLTICMGGYGPPETSFSRGLASIREHLAMNFGDGIETRMVWNVMNFGYGSEDVSWLVERGILSLGYLSTSGLSGRIPELGIPDLPFLFRSLPEARAAIDGAFGTFLADSIERVMNVRVLGFFENGFRQISNNQRQVRSPPELSGMKLRVLNSRIQARAFELMGAVPVHVALSKLDAALQQRTIDAQENPLANTLVYGVHSHHRHHTMTNHFYVSRAIFAHRESFDSYPRDIQDGLRAAVSHAVRQQREWAETEEVRARHEIEAAGCEVLDLEADEAELFRIAVRPIYGEARQEFGQSFLQVADYIQ